MRRRRVLVVLAGAAVVWGAGPLAVPGAVSAWAVAATRGAVPAGAARAAGSWGRAIEVPGLAALNTGEGARVNSVSCASPGNCAAGGHYTDRHGQQGFVVSERNGRWGQAIEVPGLGALNKAGGADVVSVSCASAGNCAAGGYYSWDPGVPYFRVNAFVAAEHGGRWGKAVPLPAGDGYISSISCAPGGACLAGGNAASCYCYTGNAFVVRERAGRLGKAQSVPGLRALEHGGAADVAGSWIDSVACPSAGNCAVGGAYLDNSGNQYVFVAGERNGVWGAAIQVPGLAALNAADGDVEVNSLSCGTAGNCVAGGYYTDDDQDIQGFVAIEDNGTWGTATEVPGLAALNTGGYAEVNSVSCGTAGSCLAGGYYTDGDHAQAFVAIEDNGTWGTATGVPGLAALNTGGRSTQVLTVSCTPTGDCAAGGFYSDRSHHRQGFVASEDNGVWGTTIEVPGLGALNAGGDAEVSSVSCPSPGDCAAGGFYADQSGHHQGFVTQAR